MAKTKLWKARAPYKQAVPWLTDMAHLLNGITGTEFKASMESGMLVIEAPNHLCLGVIETSIKKLSPYKLRSA